MSVRVTTSTRAPGRVNLLGEHTDYNDGFVLPIAIDRFTAVQLDEREDGLVTVDATDLGESDLFQLGLIKATGGWRDYVRGVVRLLEPTKGAHLRISSTLPRGVGLSSSAALEVAVARAFSDIPGPDLAVLCQRAENEFVGVDCGIMDQFVVANARAGHALLLDCRDLSYRHIPLPAGVSIVVCDSHLERRLSGSPYNDRRSSCEQAASALGLPALRDAELDQLAGLPLGLRKRARHVVTENARALDGADALSRGDVTGFGVLMDESHRSLRDDFEVCPPAIDAIAAAIRSVPGCYGARLTGAGFGGCTVALVESNSVEDVRRVAQKLGTTVHECQAAAGVESLTST
jgi:galactokinase